MSTLIADRRTTPTPTGTRGGRAEGSGPSGIARRLRAWFPASPGAIVANYASAASLIVLGYAYYATVPFASPTTRLFYRGAFSPEGLEAIGAFAIGYLALLPLFYATFPDHHAVKCRRFWRAIAALPHRRPTGEEAVAIRAVAVKAFFWPLMVGWLASQVGAAASSGATFLSSGRCFPDGYSAIYHGLFAVDVTIFAVGYGLEHPRLRNEIRSVEPTVLGWLAALICYPPLARVAWDSLGWSSAELPPFRSPAIQAAAAVAILAGVGVYVWATVSLGLRASNLTNRGIVATGPYRWVRHPAYVGKNASWWIGAIPAFAALGSADPARLAPAILGTAAWSAIYVLRAITEERHLASDPEYRAYCSRVRWRFVPGLI